MEFHKYIKPGITVFVAAIAFLIGSKFFTYFTYSAEPEVRIVGLENGESYKGMVNGVIKGENDYKIYSVKLNLDGEPFVVEGAEFVRSKNFDLPFELNTNELEDGKHTLKIEAVDSSYNSNKTENQIDFYVDNTPLKAAFLQTDYKVVQGRTLQPKFQLNKPVKSATIKLFSKNYECYPASKDSIIYESFIPVDCEQIPDEYLISLEVEDKVGNVSKLSSSVRVNKAVFTKQKGFYVASEKLEDEKEVSMSDKILKVALDKWLANSPKEKLWKGAFETPTVIKRVATPFGEIRVTPEKGRYLHKAVDIINNPKSVVWASNNGKVIIKDRYLMSGNTVVIDHGLGVFTQYFHLEDFADIEVGDFIKKGQPVGKLGMSGYASGYHLHWELSVNGVSVEPLEWTKKVY